MRVPSPVPTRKVVLAIMTDEPGEAPKRDPNENPWYWLATLYGEPEYDDHGLRARNRVAWNRYMAGQLADKARARLIEKGRHPDEELTPFTPDEMKFLARDFARRSGSQDSLPRPEVEKEIDFSGAQFNKFFASAFLFPTKTIFRRAVNESGFCGNCGRGVGLVGARFRLGRRYGTGSNSNSHYPRPHVQRDGDTATTSARTCSGTAIL